MTAKQIPARRQFLQKLTAIVGGTATIAVASSVVSASAEPVNKAEAVAAPQAKGYQRTAHVDSYYKLADF